MCCAKLHLLTPGFLSCDFVYAWLDNCNSFLHSPPPSKESGMCVVSYFDFSQLKGFSYQVVAASIATQVLCMCVCVYICLGAQS